MRYIEASIKTEGAREREKKKARRREQHESSTNYFFIPNKSEGWARRDASAKSGALSGRIIINATDAYFMPRNRELLRRGPANEINGHTADSDSGLS